MPKTLLATGLCVMLLAMDNTHANTNSIDTLGWMVGPWRGSLGEQTVEEDWSAPNAGHMSTMVRLSSAAGIDMVELIAIEATDAGLMLYLRQFSPELEPRLSQDMRVQELTPTSVSFSTEDQSPIQGLGYTLVDADTMRVDVTVMGGNVLSAVLKRR